MNLLKSTPLETPIVRYQLRNEYNHKRWWIKEESLSLTRRIWAVALTIFSLVPTVFSLFAERNVMIMKEHALAVWTGLQYITLTLFKIGLCTIPMDLINSLEKLIKNGSVIFENDQGSFITSLSSCDLEWSLVK